jgi:hypothetical protein
MVAPNEFVWIVLLLPPPMVEAAELVWIALIKPPAIVAS